jgi:hypothetical protein
VAHGDIESLWRAHREADWPKGLASNEGELMTLDTVIGGCVIYFLEENGLDSQRAGMLESCLADLHGLMADLSDDAMTYFERLRALGQLLLARRPCS